MTRFSSMIVVELGSLEIVGGVVSTSFLGSYLTCFGSGCGVGRGVGRYLVCFGPDLELFSALKQPQPI